MSDASDRSPEQPQSAAGPPPEPAAALPDDPRLFQAAQEYLEELEQGRRPDRRQWLTRYPELAAALNECLDGLDFLHQAAASVSSFKRPAPEPGAALEPGMPIGDFQIVREIGRGGMGIIYEATQLSLGRRVALKVLPLAAGFDAKYLQRFRQEAQAAAQLHHTNIVPVYAVGCERGIHFYAMQLIDGQSLDRIIQELRGEAGMAPAETSSANVLSVRPRNGATADVPPTEPLGAARTSGAAPAHAAAPRTEARAEETVARLSADFSTQRGRGRADVYRTAARFMAQAAEALEYAHQQGIVHRDIKPGNLLIDTRRNLWITDFGLAHLHGDENLTRTGDLLGTLRYASPEQVLGQRVILDHRTDIYSLGATFYELLTLRPIFPGPSRQALLHQVLNQEPATPRSLDASLPPELETILLKSLSKGPAERYNSAQELADDLRRFLRDEPIRARRPSFLERMRKWARRHPAYVTAVVLVMFVTLLISGVSNWLITRANIRTQAALTAERLRAEEAEQRFSQARQAVDLLIEVSENDLADKPPLQPLQKRLLEAALVYYQDFIAQHHGNPASEAELVSVQQRVKKVLDDLSVMEGAGQLILLADKSVQADLTLGEAEQQRIESLVSQMSQQRWESLRGFERLGPAERRARFLELARTSEHALRSILSERQIKRLGQIKLQIDGLRTLSQPEIVAALRLSESQRQALRQIEIETFAFEHEHWGPPGGPPRAGPRENPFQAALQKGLALLTPEQLGKWKELTGPPFHGHPWFPPPGMPPRP